MTTKKAAAKDKDEAQGVDTKCPNCGYPFNTESKERALEPEAEKTDDAADLDPFKDLS